MKRLSITPLCMALASLATAGCSDRHQQECLSLYDQMVKEDANDSRPQEQGNDSQVQEEGDDAPAARMTTPQKFRAHHCRFD